MAQLPAVDVQAVLVDGVELTPSGTGAVQHLAQLDAGNVDAFRIGYMKVGGPYLEARMAATGMVGKFGLKVEASQTFLPSGDAEYTFTLTLTALEAVEYVALAMNLAASFLGIDDGSVVASEWNTTNIPVQTGVNNESNYAQTGIKRSMAVNETVTTSFTVTVPAAAFTLA
jgi:hypothetical protein